MKHMIHEQWKKYFESAGCSIYEIIHNAIRVAALDDPKKFRIRRGWIAESLYSNCQLSGHCCSDQMNHHQSNVENTKDKKSGCANNKVQVDGHVGDLEVHGERGTDDKVEEHENNDDGQMISLLQSNRYSTSNYTMQETEELDEKIEEEHNNIRHILEIKELLEDSENKTETEIIDSLQMLRIIVRSVEDLKVTNIRKTVSDVQQHHYHASKISQTAKMVAGIFKRMIKERIDANAKLSERTKGPDPPTLLDEYVLPTPPMDEGIPIVNIPPGELTTFFDELDDDGNPKISSESEKFHERQINRPKEKKGGTKLLQGSASTRATTLHKEKPVLTNKLMNPKNSRPSHISCETEIIHEGQSNPSKKNMRKHVLQFLEDLEPFPTIKRPKIARKLESGDKLSNQKTSAPSDSKYSTQRYGKQKLEIDADNERKTQKKKDKQKSNQRSNAVIRQSLGSSSDDVAMMDEKLENSKKKLLRGYQEHEKAKRSTKFVGAISDVPKDENWSRSSRWRYNNLMYWKW